MNRWAHHVTSVTWNRPKPSNLQRWAMMLKKPLQNRFWQVGRSDGKETWNQSFRFIMQPWFYIPFLKLVTLVTNGGAGGLQQVSQLARAARTARSISIRSEQIARSCRTSNTATNVTSSRWGSCYTWRYFRHWSPGNRHRRKKLIPKSRQHLRRKSSI